MHLVRAKRIGCCLFLILLATLSVGSKGFTQEAIVSTNSADDISPIETETRDIEGWTVHVDKNLFSEANKQDGELALQMLGNHLQRIKILVPAEPLGKLQQVEFRVDWEHPGIKTACYHPSKGWLLKNGYSASLARKIHIPRASVLISREQMLKHPAFVLHELAHAYHDQILSFSNEEIRSAFESAKKSGKYEKILAHTGRKVRHYGLNNPQEYFAEATEAFFYRNDFYPFLRAELREFDPRMESLLRKLWKVN